MAVEFQNPIIPGFAPDPSVVLVGDTYFLVNSSFHMFPGLPIYASKNLKSWKHIGRKNSQPPAVVKKLTLISQAMQSIAPSN